MGYFTLSDTTINELKGRFYDWIRRMEKFINYKFEKQWDEETDFWRSQERKSTWLEPSYFAEKLGRAHRDVEIVREAKIEILEKLIDEFEMFIDIVAAEIIDPSDLGKRIVFDFYEYTITRREEPGLAPNRYYFKFSGRWQSMYNEKFTLDFSGVSLSVNKFEDL